MELTIKIELPQELVLSLTELIKNVGGQVKTVDIPLGGKDFTIVPEKMYTTKQTAEILNIGSAALNRLVREEIIPSSKPGKKRLFKGQDIINYIENGKA